MLRRTFLAGTVGFASYFLGNKSETTNNIYYYGKMQGRREIYKYLRNYITDDDGAIYTLE